MREVKALCDEGMRLHGLGKLDEAARFYDQVLCKLDAPDPNLLYLYGTLLVSQQKYGLGLALLRTSASVYDKHAPTWCNIGCALKFIGKDEESFKAYEKAYALEPDSPDILAGIGGYWIGKGNADRVVELSQKALQKDPNHDAAKFHLGMGLLEQGKWTEAWPYYDYRWEAPDRKGDKRPYQCPRWTGEKVKVLAIHGEQGLGDEIMFMSLFRKAQELADEVVIECATRLVKIFSDSFGVRCYPDHASLIANEGEPSAYIPMGSLPSVLGLPDGSAYLKRPNHVHTGKPVIGLAWRGGTARTGASDRTLTLDNFAPILSSIDASFVSVQYGNADVDTEAQAHGLETGPRDFDSLQFRIGTCDLVVSVLQTAVHQAGSMGVPCLALTPVRHPWAFTSPDPMNETMAWYKSVELLRQWKEGSWASPIAQACQRIREMFPDRI